jgi:hypothetical protein
MWNSLRRTCLILSFSFQFLNSLNAQHSDNREREWSGWMTYKSIQRSSWSGNLAIGSDYSELRMEASISHGRGRAHSTDNTHSTNTTKNYDGRQHTVTTEGFASGDDTTTVWIDILDASTYEIEFRVPNPKGTLTTNGVSRPYSWADPPEAPLSMTVSNQKLGKNPKVLAGEEITNSSNENGEFVIIIRWCLTRGPIDLDLIVTPLEYNTWLPSPGSDEKIPGSNITIGLQVKGKNGKPPSFKAKYFELELKNTSRENGITINYPAKKSAGALPLPDLGFVPQEGATIAKDGQAIKVIC